VKHELELAPAACGLTESPAGTVNSSRSTAGTLDRLPTPLTLPEHVPPHPEGGHARRATNTQTDPPIRLREPGAT